ncbi:Putative lumazine-binding [Catalinimonas alkaloidigena]|uniref:Putative lumazine-binding n=1 Tax=Catalinimonas alkaloidigena TaxID=1075417 RepID=A0A1G9HH62_9BACT|nr:nuclear transport factor 2 family protein [Catalinimonas alkaloidigena]SDL11843.1 Putative lumazine-binding [Catalinimonas alkaloidigena]
MRAPLLYACFCTLLLSHALCAQANRTAQDEVLDVVDQLFEAMQKGDSTMARTVFTKNARAFSVVTQAGQPVLQEGSIDAFIKAIGTPHKEVWNERVWDIEVRIDGALATVWERYAFYLDDRLHHCGTDAFQLFRGPDGWKIFHIADTRQEQGCTDPPTR